MAATNKKNRVNQYLYFHFSFHLEFFELLFGLNQVLELFRYI